MGGLVDMLASIGCLHNIHKQLVHYIGVNLCSQVLQRDIKCVQAVENCYSDYKTKSQCLLVIRCVKHITTV